MNTDQALKLIAQVLAQLRGTRQEHAQLQQAEMVLMELVKPKKKKS